MSQVSAFTRKYSGLTNVLTSRVQITAPFTGAVDQQPPQASEFTAIWDTGATNSVITAGVVQNLGLRPIGKVQTNTAGGTRIADVYLVNITLPNNITVPNVRVSEGIIQGTDILIGMDLIGLGDFSVTNMNGQTVMSFRVPSCCEVDYVKEINDATLPRSERRRLEKDTAKIKKMFRA